MFHPDIPLAYRNQVVTGDARELAKVIPAESVDLILCDPVYWEIDNYEWLGELAAAVLKQGASLIAQVGSVHRFAAESAIYKQASLTALPLLAQVYDLAFRRMYDPRVMQGWKPHLWFCKGAANERNGDWLFDRFHSHGFPDKRLHDWSDNPAFFELLIVKLTGAKGIVLDPFTGSGSVPTAARKLGRNFIAFEIDPETAVLARERVAHTNPPLFVLAPEQLPLAFAPASVL